MATVIKLRTMKKWHMSRIINQLTERLKDDDYYIKRNPYFMKMIENKTVLCFLCGISIQVNDNYGTNPRNGGRHTGKYYCVTCQNKRFY